MASEKNPSIYDDRGAIGSSEELDEYGVWVKSGPQDISGESSAENFTAGVSSDDEDSGVLLDLSRDFSLSVQDEKEPSDLADFTGTEDFSGGMVPGNDDGDISDFGEFSFESPENEDSGGGDAAGENAQFVDFDIPQDAESIEIKDSDSFSEFETGARDLADTPEDAGEIKFEEIDVNGDTDLNFEDFTESITGKNSFQKPDDDFAISFDDTTSFSKTPDEESGGNRETDEVLPPAAESDTGKSEVSTQLLIRIADELSSIRNELSSLKEEFLSVKGEISRGKTAGQGQDGFFDEVDDEKIALTGTEMDNILNTASFAEEAGNDVVEGGMIDGIEIQGEPESMPIEIDMDEFVSEPVIPSHEGEQYLSEDISGLSGELDFDTGLPVSDALPDDLEAGIPDSTGELFVDEIGALSRDGEIFPDGETGDFDLGGDLLLDISPENGKETDGAFDPSIFDSPLDSSTEDSFAQLIPEGFEDKPAESPLYTEDAAIAESEFLETGFLPKDEPLDTELFSEDTSIEDIPVEDISIEDIPAAAEDAAFEEGEFPETSFLPKDELLDTELFSEDTSIEDISVEDIPATAEDGDITDLDLDLDFGFDSDLELDEDTPDGKIPEISSLDMEAEFDALAAEEDIALDVPADRENAGEKPIEFDFTEESLESPDAVAAEDIEDLLDDISFGEADTVTTGEILPDISLEDEPLFELPVEDESLSADLGDFTVEGEEIPNEEAFNEEPLEAALYEESPNAKIPAKSETELPASPPPAAEKDIPEGSALAKVPAKVRKELKTVLTYMDRLLESLPEEKIKEFAQSKYFDTYKKLFEDLGLV
jgi:hypothetical protein